LDSGLYETGLEFWDIREADRWYKRAVKKKE